MYMCVYVYGYVEQSDTSVFLVKCFNKNNNPLICSFLENALYIIVNITVYVRAKSLYNF